MPTIREAYFNRRSAALLMLGFASGLPFILVTDTLAAIMKDAHVATEKIGSLASIVAIPYTFKFIWAPLMDRYVPPLLGRRRGWLLVMQTLLIAAIALLSFIDPGQAFAAFAAAALIVAFLSASQDIVGDAYRTDVLPPEERGMGAATWVMGYRIAMLAIGGGALLLVDSALSWHATLLLIAGVMGLGLVTTLLAPEPATPASAPQTLRSAVVNPLRDMLRRPGIWAVILFVVLFTLPEVMAKTMTLPFMLDIGISKHDIGIIRQWMGFGCTIVGALVGGALAVRFPLKRLLLLFGILGAASNAGFWVLTQTGPRYGIVVGTIAVENFCDGLVKAGFGAFLMSQCDIRFSAFQFALLSGLMRLTTVLGGAPAGRLADRAGWATFFIVSILAAIPGLLFIPWLPLTRPQDIEHDPPRPLDLKTEPPSPR